jgi:hypothetical protein
MMNVEKISLAISIIFNILLWLLYTNISEKHRCLVAERATRRKQYIKRL